MRSPTALPFFPALGPVLALAACAHGGTLGPRSAPPPAPVPTAASPVRYFGGGMEDTFRVSHGPDLDRSIVGGARLEIRPGGEITAAAWESDLASRSEPVLGALAVPARLGGGFVVWTRARVFFSREFTGPLSPVDPGVPGELAVRGARAGLASVTVFTDAGPREMLPGSLRLGPIHDPALIDVAAVSAERAARLDLFGRLSLTTDGGRRWIDLSPSGGRGVRHLAVGPDALWADGWQGRFLVGPGGKLAPADPPDRAIGYDMPRGFQVAWPGDHEHEDWPWALREAGPLGVVVAGGAAVGDGTAMGVLAGSVVRVELATGKLLSLASDWIPSGISCQPLSAPDGVLFACNWERSQGYGGYVLRSVDGGPPVVERAFSEDGAFVASDDGALGFVGGCRAEVRAFEPNDSSRYEMGSEAPLSTSICVRARPGQWVEHRVELGEGATLVAWVPHRDGSATALALAAGPLPLPAGAPRVLQQGGARLVRLAPEIPGWSFKRPPWQADRLGLSGAVDRRFHARDDGSIDGWLTPAGDGADPVLLGVTIDPGGVPTVHDVAPGAVETTAGGAFALSLGRDGSLHESLDHGRTWRAAGRSPLPPGAAGQGMGACSALGCLLGGVVRFGWGDSALTPSVSAEQLPPPPPSPLPRLVCSPHGAPVPGTAVPPAPPGARQVLATGWGDTLEIVRDAAAPEPAPVPPSPSGVGPPVTAAPSPARPVASKKPRASPAVLRTHTLLVRPPFSPSAALRRLNATDASFNPQRRSVVVPLLGPGGDVDLLVGGDRSELLVSGEKITVWPWSDGRRASGDASPTGASVPGGRAMILGELRRRLALEDHGPGAGTRRSSSDWSATPSATGR